MAKAITNYIHKTKMTAPPFSVLISTYKNDSPEALHQSLLSLFEQSLVPNEIVLVVDGPIELVNDEVINEMQMLHPEIFKIYRLDKNKGLGNALAFGLTKCSHELVARMDSDDIADSNRFKKQIDFFDKHPETAVLGGWMSEFRKLPGDIESVKTAPIGNEKVKQYARMRNPLNHPTVMFKKSVIIAVGSYKEINLFEDYYLWLRVLKNGYTVSNIDDILVHFRIGNDMVERRHGFSYMLKELAFFKRCYKEKLITVDALLLQIVTRLPLRLMPKQILKLIYKNMLRKKKS